MKSKPYRFPLPASRQQLVQMLDRLRDDTLEEPDRQLLMHLVQQVLGPDPGTPSTPLSHSSTAASQQATIPDQTNRTDSDTQRRGHGRKTASAYPGARRVRCADPTRPAGDRCPCGGRLYDTHLPALFLRFTGQPLVGATHYEQQVLRCSSCRQRFTAPLPADVPAEKYDGNADVAMVPAKYAAGLPFHRPARLQQSFGAPLPESVQGERCEAVAAALLPVSVYLYLRTLAAQAEALIGEDTRVKILSCERENQQRAVAGERHGLRTTGVVAQSPKSRRPEVVLYKSGRQHAGENVGELLPSRSAALAPPLPVGDAAARNWSHALPVIAVKCLAPARQQFTDIEELFPQECAHVREAPATVYRVEAETKAVRPEERLAHHQRHSAPVREQLQRWIEEQFQERRVEPNSALGKAPAYLQRHWPGLTQVLSRRSAPLDSNVVERALKRVVLHRKNALFFRTEHGAAVGDILRSVIETCRVQGIRAWDYLVGVLKNSRAVRGDPAR